MSPSPEEIFSMEDNHRKVVPVVFPKKALLEYPEIGDGWLYYLELYKCYQLLCCVNEKNIFVNINDSDIFNQECRESFSVEFQ